MKYFFTAKTYHFYLLTGTLALLLNMATGIPALTQDRYLFGPRDVISINVYAGGENQLSVDLTIDSEGMIIMPFLGPLKAVDLSVSDLNKSITEQLAQDYFVNPQVTITIKEYHSLAFYISGAVANPGLYEMEHETTLLNLIVKAGGMAPVHGYTAYIIREDHTLPDKAEQSKTLTVNLLSLLNQGDMRENIKLKPGDIIHIPSVTGLDQSGNNIFIEGEVNRPGIYPYQPGTTALSACLLAGGFNQFAAPNRAKIIRQKTSGQEIIQINLDEVKTGKVKDLEIQAGDLIHIPETWM